MGLAFLSVHAFFLIIVSSRIISKDSANYGLFFQGEFLMVPFVVRTSTSTHGL